MRSGDFGLEVVPVRDENVRETDTGHVLARPGVVYGIRLRNYGPLRCVANVRLDGKAVTAGGLVLDYGFPQIRFPFAYATLDKLKHDALEPAMLESARAYVLGQYPLRLETAAHWASALADLEFYGLGKEYIEGYGPALSRVDLAETAAVTADAFPRSSDLLIVLIGDASKIRDMAAKYGPVTEMKLSQPDFVPAKN